MVWRTIATLCGPELRSRPLTKDEEVEAAGKPREL
jgi:hypothetical protein